MGGSGDNEGTGGLREETRSWSVPQASQLGYPTKNRDQQVTIGKPAETNLAELAAGLLRRCDENTLVRAAIDGKSLRQNSGTADVRMELDGKRAEDVDLTRQVETWQQESRVLSNAGVTHCQG